MPNNLVLGGADLKLCVPWGGVGWGVLGEHIYYEYDLGLLAQQALGGTGTVMLIAGCEPNI